MSESTVETPPSDLEIATDILDPIIEAGGDEGKMVIALIEAEFKASKALTLIRLVLESKGLLLSNKDRYTQVEENLANWDFANNVGDWENIDALAVTLSEEIEATSKSQALASIRKFAKANSIELPAKPKGAVGSRGNKFDEFYTFALANRDASPGEIVEFIDGFGSTENQAKKYVSFFGGILGFARKFAE